MSLRTRFILFSVIFLGILGALTISVWVRGLENERAQRQIESDLEEASALLVIEEHVEEVRLAMLPRTWTANQETRAQAAIGNAASLVHQLRDSVENDEIEDDAAQKEMQSIGQLLPQLEQLDSLLASRAAGEVGEDFERTQEQLFRDIHSSFELFREGAFEEIHDAVKRLNGQQDALETMVVKGALLLMVLLGLAWVGFCYGLLRPVHDLTRMTRRLSQIDFNVEEKTVPKGELGELTLSFISMARSLESFTREIEARVAERTQELEASRSLLRLMLDSMPDAIGLRRADGSLLACNGMYRELFPSAEQGVSNLMQTEPTPQGYFPWRGENSRSRLLALQIFSTQIPNQESESVRLEYIRDVTRLTEVESALAQSQRLVALGRLAAGIAHEVNSPLTAIGACAEGLIDRSESGDLDPEEVREYLQIIHQEVYRCKSLTERLLDVSRQRNEETEPTDVTAVVQECLKLLAYLNKSRCIDIRVTTKEDQSAALALAKPAALRQICINLLMNANNASAEGARIEVEVRVAEEHVSLLVRDEGIGVAHEDMDRLFDPFFTKRRNKEGTGLGLFLCRELASAMGGKLNAYSDGPGEGACFELCLQRIPSTQQIQQVI